MDFKYVARSVAKEIETYQVVGNCKYLTKDNIKKKMVFIFEFYDKLRARNIQNIFFNFLKNLGGVSTLKTLNLSDFQNGQIVTKQLLKRLNILECPYAFIKKYGFETIGVSD